METRSTNSKTQQEASRQTHAAAEQIHAGLPVKTDLKAGSLNDGGSRDVRDKLPCQNENTL